MTYEEQLERQYHPENFESDSESIQYELEEEEKWFKINKLNATIGKEILNGINGTKI